MSDFMLWLHANYIQPNIDALEKENYIFDFERLQEELPPASQRNLERALAFTAIHAFLLGFRTSEGLPDLPSRRRAALRNPCPNGSCGS